MLRLGHLFEAIFRVPAADLGVPVGPFLKQVVEIAIRFDFLNAWHLVLDRLAHGRGLSQSLFATLVVYFRWVDANTSI